MTKEQKAHVIQDAVEHIQRSAGIYVLSFSGLTVEKADELRGEFFKIGVDYKVTKNTLLKRAFEQVGGYDDIYPYLVGQSGVVYSYDDPIEPARVLKKFLKDNENMLTVKVCMIDSEVLDGTRLNDLAMLPTREELIAGIIGCIAAPASGIVGALNGVITGIVNVIDAIEKQQQDQAA